MEKYTTDEKTEIINALQNYIDVIEVGRRGFTNSGEFLPQIWKLQELRAKLILDISPIKIYTEDNGNQHIYDKWYFHCHLCGKTEGISFPERPTIDKYNICSECFKKHSPDLFQEVSERNARFFDEQIEAEEPDPNNKDGKTMQLNWRFDPITGKVTDQNEASK